MACFLIGVTGEGVSVDGDALLGSVSDDPYDVRTQLRTVRPAGALAHVGTELVSTTERTLADRGYFSHPNETGRGVNEAGLAFTIALALEAETARPAGAIDFADIVDGMMGRCETVDDALALFQSASAVRPAFSVLLADAAGELAHVEAGSFGVRVYERYGRARPGIALAVNCYLSPALAPHNAPAAMLDEPANNNGVRRARGRELAARGDRAPDADALDVDEIARILSDHANRDRDPTTNPFCGVWGYSICNHGTRRQDTCTEIDLPWGTVSAEILAPASRTFWYAYGWPCGEPPEHGDQRFQERSWGRFVPFGIADDTEAMTLLTTPGGDVTPAGMRARRDR